MIKKRLIGVVTVKNGWAVQSFGYKRYLPLGKPECLIENLDRWGADEILIQVIDASCSNRGPDFDLLERLGRLGLETPLIYAGGIRSVSDGAKLIQLGADRLMVDALLHDEPSVIEGLANQLGAQALIASMPLAISQGGLTWFDYRRKILKPIGVDISNFLLTGVCSEVLIIDWRNEGVVNQFNYELIEKFPLKNMSIIAFGGISESSQIKTILGKREVAAIAIGNFLNYREHAIQDYKASLVDFGFRVPSYQSDLTKRANPYA